MGVMKKAWQIAKEAVGKFGGKAREYFAEALKEAWKQASVEKMVEVFKAAKIKLKGTKRQVEVAFEIRAEYQMTIEKRAAEMRGSLKTQEQFEALNAALAKVEAEMLYLDSVGAGKWIEEKGGYLNWGVTDLDLLAKRNGLIFERCAKTGQIFGLQA